MVEITLILVIISTALITIISGITKTTRYISEMRQRTIALNLAKEGIEAVYNIRNTNWRRRSANRDQCWLKLNPMVDEGNTGCEDDPMFSQEIRYSLNKNSNNHGSFFSLYPVWYQESFYFYPYGPSTPNQEATPMKESARLVRNPRALSSLIKEMKPEHILSGHQDLLLWKYEHILSGHRDLLLWKYESFPKYRLYFVDQKRVDDPNFTKLKKQGKIENTALWEYWRFIVWDGIYDKEGNKLNCNKATPNPKCNDNSAKELRFCSTVIYSFPYQGIVNLCAIMTNFLE